MNRTRSLARRTAAVAAAGAAALVLAACGGNGDDTGSAGHGGHNVTASASASASQGQHNAADVAFAKGMIPHHRQAVEMADLAPERAQSPEVKKLAADIKKAQDPEIKTLSGWLTSWGEEVPAEGAMDHSMHGGMEGMMSAEEMTELENLSGKAFDTAFMEMMIKHHEGAVEMAKTEQADGAYEPAKKMAGQIITSQSAEIEQMNKLLGKD
ncbi:lipoprotein [Streptomyces werraensis]|nr:lipoprotein [Streptomyces werraensis]